MIIKKINKKVLSKLIYCFTLILFLNTTCKKSNGSIELINKSDNSIIIDSIEANNGLLSQKIQIEVEKESSYILVMEFPVDTILKLNIREFTLFYREKENDKSYNSVISSKKITAFGLKKMYIGNIDIVR
jgi:hypothetical protein